MIASLKRTFAPPRQWFCVAGLAIGFGLVAAHGVGFASSYGYSLNLNLAGGDAPIRVPAGLFGETVWNNLPNETGGENFPLISDTFGDFNQSAASVSWNAARIGKNDDIQVENPGDARLMESFFRSPSVIKLDALEFVPPRHRGPLNYTVLIYSYGGQEGAKGEFVVNGVRQPHIDSGEFDGTFRTGVRGNVLIFPDFKQNQVEIFSEGETTINAISLMYCRPGDFNGDGLVDVTDLDALSKASKDGSEDWQYDINIDGEVNNNDVLAWIKWSKGTCIGDVNLDGVFDSSDLVQLFQVGIYENDDEATWTTGDWNGDCVFDSSDLILAFQEGCYESDDARAAPAESVPEPTSGMLFGLGIVGWILRNRRVLDKPRQKWGER